MKDYYHILLAIFFPIAVGIIMILIQGLDNGRKSYISS